MVSIIKLISGAKNLLRITLLIFLSAGILSCSKDLNTADVDFKVIASTTTAKAGEPVSFSFEGNPDVITFYSGEMGNDYAFINTDRVLPTKSVNVSFQSQTRRAVTAACQQNQFHIMISGNLSFSGTTKADSLAAISNASWTEITDRFTICPLECLSTTPFYPSGTADIIDLLEPGKQYHIAFKYINYPYTPVIGYPNIWRFSSFNLSSVTEVGSVNLITQANGKWSPVYFGSGWVAVSYANTGAMVTMRAGTHTSSEAAALWCVSIPFGLTETNLGREFGVGIKSLSDTAPLTNYQHKFEKPGVYNVTFVAINQNVDNRKEVIKQVQIVVD